MLLYLHAKNYALIDDVEVEFTDGLNILTGETGAGKSVLLGSIQQALGGKSKTDVIRDGEESAFVELQFGIDNDYQRDLLKEMDIDAEDDLVVIQRKITHQRSVGKICGVTVSSSDLRRIADSFLDIYGQHDYQNLLKESMHIEILDGFAGAELNALKQKVAEEYSQYAKLRTEADSLEEDASKRQRDMEFLKFQLDEIKAANIREGEEEELKEYLHLAENGERIAKALTNVELSLSEDDGVLRQFTYAFRELSSVSGLTPEIGGFEESLEQAQDIVQDTLRSMQNYLDGLDFDEQTLKESRERYDEIVSLFMKYGKNFEGMQKFVEEKTKEYEKLVSFESYRDDLFARLNASEKKLSKLCEELSELRKAEGEKFASEVSLALTDLNFNDNRFEVRFERNEKYTAKGFDNAVFWISTNVGEQMRPICDVASGGELSRIMLAIKTVSAGREYIHTLIFDEIDAGISGNTAWKVSEKLGLLGRDLQVICITHLPQIAAMADTHFEILKSEKEGHTVTEVKKLFQYESVEELTRLLGGGDKKEAATENAKELIHQAKKLKKKFEAG